MSGKFRKLAKKLSIEQSRARAKKARAKYPSMPQPGFVEGYGSVIDWGGRLEELLALYGSTKSGEELDVQVIAKDWYIVGEDLLIAIKKNRERRESAR